MPLSPRPLPCEGSATASPRAPTRPFALFSRSCLGRVMLCSPHKYRRYRALRPYPTISVSLPGQTAPSCAAVLLCCSAGKVIRHTEYLRVNTAYDYCCCLASRSISSNMATRRLIRAALTADALSNREPTKISHGRLRGANPDSSSNYD